MNQLNSLQDALHKLSKKVTKLWEPTHFESDNPAVTIFKQDNNFVLVAEIPELSSSDLEVDVERDKFHISGKILNLEENADESFDRTFHFPFAIDTKQSRIEYESGKLRMELVKAKN